MNDYPHSPDDAIPETEWKLQERALRAERLHLSGHGDNAEMREYRAVTRVLLQPLPDPLPADFAARVAGLVASRPGPAAQERIERMLLTAFAAMLALTTVILCAADIHQWWHALTSLVPLKLMTNPLLLALTACVAVTAALDHWQRRLD